MTLLLWLIVAYLIGAIPIGLILTRLSGGEDIRRSGSGNIGATNVYRVAGRVLGIATLIGDCLKGLLPVLAAEYAFPAGPVTPALVGLAAFCGHCYPVYLGFRGGKGVATALGVFLVISLKAVLAAFAVFGLVLWKWRFISLASVSAAASIPLLILYFTRSLVLFGITLIIAVVVIWRHRTNLERLRSGSENRFSF